MENLRWRQVAILFHLGGRRGLCFRGPLGAMEKSPERRIIGHLHYIDYRTEPPYESIPSPHAGHPSPQRLPRMDDNSDKPHSPLQTSGVINHQTSSGVHQSEFGQVRPSGVHHPSPIAARFIQLKRQGQQIGLF